jgi:hypothetical protein
MCRDNARNPPAGIPNQYTVMTNNQLDSAEKSNVRALPPCRASKLLLAFRYSTRHIFAPCRSLCSLHSLRPILSRNTSWATLPPSFPRYLRQSARVFATLEIRTVHATDFSIYDFQSKRSAGESDEAQLQAVRFKAPHRESSLRLLSHHLKGGAIRGSTCRIVYVRKSR